MQATAAVGCLLLQSLCDEYLFLSEYFAQERLWVQRSDTPRLQVLWFNVAKVQSNDYQRVAMGRRSQHVTILASPKWARNSASR